MFFRRIECCNFVHNSMPYIHPRPDLKKIAEAVPNARRSWNIWTIWRSATHAISQHHYRDMHCTKWSRAHQSPSNLFSCPESGLKFAYFAIKFFQLIFTVQRWQSGIALRKANWIDIVIKEKKNNLIEQPHVSYLTRLPLSHSGHPMLVLRLRT